MQTLRVGNIRSPQSSIYCQQLSALFCLILTVKHDEIAIIAYASSEAAIYHDAINENNALARNGQDDHMHIPRIPISAIRAIRDVARSFRNRRRRTLDEGL